LRPNMCQLRTYWLNGKAPADAGASFFNSIYSIADGR
jgi:hypothetical protein